MELSAEYVRSVMEYSPDTGVFVWRYRSDVPKEWNTRFAGREIRNRRTSGHLFAILNYQQIPLHRLAWLYMMGEMPENLIDHINGDRADNRWSNLRQATTFQNAQNRIASSRSSHGLKGLHWHKAAQKWCAQIRANGRREYLGLFESKDDALAAYRVAAERLHGEFARVA